MTVYTKENLHFKLEEIYHSIIKDRNGNNDIGLMSGKMGHVLFLYYYSLFEKDTSLLVNAEELIHEIISEIDKGFNLPTFCSGVFGVAWGFDLLIEESFINLGSDTFFIEFDNFYDEVVEEHFEIQNYDFLHGYIGLGMYLLKRYQNTHSNKSKEVYRRKLNVIIQQLRKTACVHDNAIYWISKRDKERPNQDINMGLAHGVPCVINFLSRMILHSHFSKAVRPLLSKVILFVLHFKTSNKNKTSLFANSASVDSVKEGLSSRLAWCYGDLGIGLSLWHAARALGDEVVYREAMVILKYSARRKDLLKNSVKDAGLCHGGMGIMLIFDYLFKSTGEKDFQNATSFWLNQSMDMSIHKDGNAGFMSWHSSSQQWKNETDLLDGAAGIGLALVSYLSPKPLLWNQCLMIS